MKTELYCIYTHRTEAIEASWTEKAAIYSVTDGNSETCANDTLHYSSQRMFHQSKMPSVQIGIKCDALEVAKSNQ